VSIVLIDYNAGNVKSVQNAFKRLNTEIILTSDKALIEAADKVIFPGVGEASTTMNYLNETGLADTIRQLKQPFLGICLGMHVLCAFSEENNTECLGIFNQTVKKFTNVPKVPHMGWNTTEIKNKHTLFSMENAFFYYVHSYFVEPCENTIATCTYTFPFSAALQKDNFYAVQFHPEKSADAGETLLQRFLEL